MQDYSRLLVWQRARALTVAVHEVSRRIPQGTAPGLRAQLMRATMSIAANIAEGAGRETKLDFARFVTIAIASTSETEHHLSVCCDLGLIEAGTGDRMMARCTELRRMLFALRRAILAAESERLAHAPVSDQARASDPGLAH